MGSDVGGEFDRHSDLDPVCVLLWAESGPLSVQRGDGLSDMDFSFDLTTSRDAIERAAAQSDAERVKFPERGDPTS